MSKKQLLATLLTTTKATTMLAPLGGNSLVALNYHRIRPDKPDFDTPFDDGVYGPTAAQFFEQIRWLKKYRTILSENDLIDRLKSDKAGLKRCVVVTFDDGYRDNYDLAFPILRDLAVPATFFIPSHIINTRQLGWWDMVAYLLKRCKKTSINFEGVLLPLVERRHEVMQFFTQKIKLEKYENTKDLLAKLSIACEVEFPTFASQDSQLMTWDQIRKVSHDIITIGSHTHTHRVLSTLDPMSQKEELGLSKAILEEKIGQVVRSIAYPVGGTRHFSEQTQSIAQECGYKLGFSFRTGLNINESLAPMNISRAAGPSQFSMVAAMSVLPKIFIDSEDASRYNTQFNFATTV